MGSMARRSALIVFPALALAFSASCASAVTEHAPDSSAARTSAPASTRSSAAAGSSSSVTKSAAAPGSVSPAATNASTTALSVLAGIRIARETPAGYVRAKFRHWVDADGDGCNTREEVLVAESSSTAQVSWPGCKVIEGDWVSAYDGVAVTDPSNLDIDHFVPLKEAWDSGAGSWSSSKREQYANDLSDVRALVAVTASSNRSKGEKDPPQWMPTNQAVFCSYLSDWVAVKARWRMSMDESEYRFIEKRLKGQCAGQTIAPWGSSAPATAPTGSGSVPATTAAPAATSPATSPATDDTVKGGLPSVHPGSFCTPKGAQGTYNGNIYVCSTTKTTGEPYKDGRARWRAA